MKRFLICGGSRFNNYFLFRKYVKEYMEPESIIVICGSPTGTDQMAREYSFKENIPIEEYPVSNRDVASVKQRNLQLISYCQSAIIFYDGSKGTVSIMKEQLMASKLPVICVELTENDNMNFNVKCKNPNICKYLDMTRRTDCTIDNIADITMGIIYNEELIRYIAESNKDEYTASDTMNIGAGISCWLRYNEVPYLQQRIKHEERTSEKKTTISLEELAKKWSFNKHPVRISTKENLLVANDFSNLIADGRQLWIEVKDDDIVKNNVWQTRDQLNDEEDNPINSYYETKDTSDTVLFFRNTDFDTAPFRAGRWYIDAGTL